MSPRKAAGREKAAESPNGKKPLGKKPLEIRIDAARAQKNITLNQLIGLDEGDKRSMRDLFGMFLIDPETDEYYPVEVGKQIIGQLPLEQLQALTDDFRSKLELSMVPRTKPRG